MALKPLKTLNFGGEDTYYLKPEWKNIAETTVIGDTLTWDGNTEGLEVADPSGDGSMPIYKISDNVPSLKGGGTIIASDGEVIQFGYNDVQNIVGDVYTLYNVVYFVMSDFDNGGTIIKKGIYVVSESVYVASLTINDYNEITPLPNKYLDFIETVGRDTLTWDGNTEGLEGFDVTGEGVPSHYRVCGFDGNIVPSEVNYSATLLTSDGEVTFTHNEMPVEEIVNGVYLFAEIFVIVVTKDGVGVDLDGFSFSKDGVYFACAEGIYPKHFTIDGTNAFATEYIKTKYLPPVNKLYVHEGDKYLYVDKETTVKATRKDVLDFLEKGVPMLSLFDGTFFYPHNVADCVAMTEIIGQERGKHCEVTYIIVSGNTVTKDTYYTAEYTG